MAEFFSRNIIEVYFFYGLSFFCLGLAITVELGHASELDFGRALIPLAGFGFIHGIHEWIEMFLIIHPLWIEGPLGNWIFPLRISLLSSSFLLLIVFGARLAVGKDRPRWVLAVLFTAILLGFCGMLVILVAYPPGSERSTMMDVCTRYTLGIPGAILAALGLMLQRRRFIAAGMGRFGNDVSLAALAFAIYGMAGQLFVSPSKIFPGIYLNSDAFMSWFGFPIQVLRASMACLVAFFMIRSLRAFGVDTARSIERLRQAQMAEQQRSERLKAEFLHRTVKAQESERQRIALELHDETGQTLTGLSLGLRGLAENIETNPQRSIEKARQLENMAAKGIQELQNLVTGMRPPQLDELGLEAALRWLANEKSQPPELQIQVLNRGLTGDLSPEVRTVLFRIAQEAVTNIVRHSNASQASIELDYQDDQVALMVKDDGQGFEVEKVMSQTSQPCWGLMGMMERAELVGGRCTIDSRPDQGTMVKVQVKLVKGTQNDYPSADRR